MKKTSQMNDKKVGLCYNSCVSRYIRFRESNELLELAT